MMHGHTYIKFETFSKQGASLISNFSQPQMLCLQFGL